MVENKQLKSLNQNLIKRAFVLKKEKMKEEINKKINKKGDKSGS